MLPRQQENIILILYVTKTTGKHYSYFKCYQDNGKHYSYLICYQENRKILFLFDMLPRQQENIILIPYVTKTTGKHYSYLICYQDNRKPLFLFDMLPRQQETITLI